MASGGPLPVLAREQIGVLRFLRPKCLAGVRLVVVLRHVSGFIAEIPELQKDAVLARELLLESQIKFELLQIIVRAEPILRSIHRIERVAAWPKGTVLGTQLKPVATARVIRPRNH